MGDEDDQNETPQSDQPEPLLTGDPDALHVFVVREADLLTFSPTATVVDSQSAAGAPPPGLSSRQPSPPSNQALAGILSDRMGTILSILTILLLLAGGAALAWSLLAPPGEATVLLIPRTWQVSLETTIQSGEGVPLRVLAPVTIARSLTVASTGVGQTQAQQARGSVTFYNGAFAPQTVAADTALTGGDGTVIVTDAAITIPAAQPTTPPTYGQASVAAHALEAGSAGNIAALDINQACCATSVLAKNLVPFTGGQDAQTYRVVAPGDIDTALRQLAPEVQEVAQARLRAALHPGEQLAPLPCQQGWTSSARVGQAASQVKVTFTMRCQAVAYRQAALQEVALSELAKLAVQQAAIPVQVEGTARVSVLSAVAAQSEGSKTTLTFAASALFIPAWTARDLQRLAATIAGKTRREASSLLLAQPGVQQAHVSLSGSSNRLPENPVQIHILVERPSVLPTPGSEPISSPSS